jgi:hypothetical protein
MPVSPDLPSQAQILAWTLLGAASPLLLIMALEYQRRGLPGALNVLRILTHI